MVRYCGRPRRDMTEQTVAALAYVAMCCLCLSSCLCLRHVKEKGFIDSPCRLGYIRGHNGPERILREVGDCTLPNVSEKVLSIIRSYTYYINRIVWLKHS